MYVCMYVGEQVWHGGEAVSCRGEQSQSEDCRSAKQLEDEPARYHTYIHTYIHTYTHINIHTYIHTRGENRVTAGGRYEKAKKNRQIQEFQ